MPQLPNIPNIFRLTLNVTADIYPTVHNVLNVSSTSTPGEFEFGVTSALQDPDCANMYDGLPNNYACTGFSYIRLDDVSGTVDVDIVDGPEGHGSTEPVMGAALLLSLKTGLRGPQHRGRLFVGPLQEACVNAGKVTSSDIAQMDASWGQFFFHLSEQSPPIIAGVASYQHASWASLVGYTHRTFVGSQVRRLKAAR